MGELIALVSSACFAASNVTITRGADRTSADNGAFLSILMTALLSGLAMLIFTPPQGSHTPNLPGVAWFALSGLLTIFVGRVFLYASVQHLGAVRASAIKRLNPVFSVLLGVTLLGEPVDLSMTAGMLLIFASFGVLAAAAWRARPPRALAGGASTTARSIASLGYLYGPISALAYATGYVARKHGLIAMPDPNFGTLIGALTGGLSFVLTGLVVESYRKAVRSTFARFNPWLVVAAVMSSVGQILQFVALNYSTISRVALINSLEVVFTMLLSLWLLRSYERISPATVIAAAMSIVGAALVIGL
ncbi:MAG: DMT family transporter [Pseudomonadota bacterium]|nr:DMT family transporter [Pseudomonadota bacterium]